MGTDRLPFGLVCRTGNTVASSQQDRFRRVAATAWKLLTPCVRRTLESCCQLYLADLRTMPNGTPCAGFCQGQLVIVNAYQLAEMSDLSAVTVLLHELFHAWSNARGYRLDEEMIDTLVEGRGLPGRAVREFLIGRAFDPGEPQER